MARTSWDEFLCRFVIPFASSESTPDMRRMSPNGLDQKFSTTLITLYHGSPQEQFTPEYGYGESKHDYGQGFYLTPDIELAKEWAAGLNDGKGWCHAYRLDLSGLRVFDFEQTDAIAWIATLASHRSPWRRVPRSIAPYLTDFLATYAVNCEAYDIVTGWRADDSYFQVVKQFVSDYLDASWLNELLRLGDLGIQYCCKSPRAFSRLTEIQPPIYVDNPIYVKKYKERDTKFRDIIDDFVAEKRARGERKVTTFSSLMGV